MAEYGSDSFRSVLADGCDFVYDYCCDLCEEDGKQREAVGFCTDCQDYLCKECFNTHLRPRPSRDHVLLGRQQMPKRKPHSFTCDLCSLDNKEEEAEGYCTDCQDYLCSECFNTHLRPKPSRHHVLLDKQHMPKDHAKSSTSSKQGSAGLAPPRKSPATFTTLKHSRDARNTRAQHAMDISVISSSDSKTPYITGCVLLTRDKLVVVDHKNSKLKLIDLAQNNIVSHLELPSDIWDITQVSSQRVAVTSYNQQTIYFVNVSDKLKLDHKVKVKGRCRGITRINQNLVVSYDDPVKVEIISIKGQVLQTVVTEDKGRQLFTWPWHVAVSKDQQTIYISDNDRHTITSVTLTGQVLATYENDKLYIPRGLTVDTAGTVYVCGVFSNNILQLTADLTEVQELLQPSDGVVPFSVCYCEDTDRLYIGMFNSDVMKVYQLK